MFLPALAAANQSLEVEREEGRLEARNLEAVDEEEGGQYIEMNLGLGVLEEKGARSESEKSEQSEGGDEASAGEEVDVLGRLMGFGKKGRRRERPGIEVLGAVA